MRGRVPSQLAGIILLLVCQMGQADTIQFENGTVWRSVRVIDAASGTSGTAVSIVPTSNSEPRGIRPGWHPQVVHIEFGSSVTSSVFHLRSPNPPRTGLVTRVVGGDILELEDGERVRLLGVTAITSGTRRDIAPLFNLTATSFTSIIAVGGKVWVECDANPYDEQGALLGYVFLLPDGVFLNEVLVSYGYADLDNKHPVRPDLLARLSAAAKLARGTGSEAKKTMASDGGLRIPQLKMEHSPIPQPAKESSWEEGWILFCGCLLAAGGLVVAVFTMRPGAAAAGAGIAFRTEYTKRGIPRYVAEIRDEELSQYAVIRDRDYSVARERALAKKRRWDEMRREKQARQKNLEQRHKRAMDIEDKRALAAQQTQEACDRIAALKAVLTSYVSDQHQTKRKNRRNYLQSALERLRNARARDERNAVSGYFETALDLSDYPDYCPRELRVDYNPTTKLMVMDYQLPTPNCFPTLRDVQYVQSRDEFVEKHISETERHQLYDNLLYQIALRSLRELFDADLLGLLDSIVFNGYVRSIDRATGHPTNGCVLSIQVKREEFQAINLANVDPKACFRKLKGVGSSELHSITPVVPILALSREDERFIPTHAVADGLQEGDNIAAMDWKEFEHLVRELFESEYVTAGGEVKVTRASRDGGIDAVVFDPDPLRGGKTVIQAKRYTNTVGVSAVRDLYGTVIHEGANKGILISTADYGPDAYEFAKDKPLQLLNGGHLLHLLQKHGRKAKIDLTEAKKILSEEKM